MKRRAAVIDRSKQIPVQNAVCSLDEPITKVEKYAPMITYRTTAAASVPFDREAGFAKGPRLRRIGINVPTQPAKKIASTEGPDASTIRVVPAS
jgi:hypothetical protein